MYGPSRPEKDVQFLAHANGFNRRRLLDPGWLGPYVFATTAVRVACIAGLKSIYTAGHGVSSTRGQAKFSNDVEVNPFTIDWDNDSSEWIDVKSTSKEKLRRTFSPKIHSDKVPVENLNPKVTAKSR